MARKGINKVQILGRLGSDPDTRYGQSGNAMTTISVATSESWKDKDGNPQERTEWHRIKFFGKLAEIAGEYLKKGREVYVEGQLRTEKYTDKQGIEKYSTDIVANEMQLIGGNPSNDGERGGHAGNERSGSRNNGNNDRGGGSRPQGHGDRSPQRNENPAPAYAGDDPVNWDDGGINF